MNVLSCWVPGLKNLHVLWDLFFCKFKGCNDPLDVSWTSLIVESLFAPRFKNKKKSSAGSRISVRQFRPWICCTGTDIPSIQSLSITSNLNQGAFRVTSIHRVTKSHPPKCSRKHFSLCMLCYIWVVYVWLFFHFADFDPHPSQCKSKDQSWKANYVNWVNLARRKGDHKQIHWHTIDNINILQVPEDYSKTQKLGEYSGTWELTWNQTKPRNCHLLPPYHNPINPGIDPSNALAKRCFQQFRFHIQNPDKIRIWSYDGIWILNIW